MSDDTRKCLTDANAVWLSRDLDGGVVVWNDEPELNEHGLFTQDEGSMLMSVPDDQIDGLLALFGLDALDEGATIQAKPPVTSTHMYIHTPVDAAPKEAEPTST